MPIIDDGESLPSVDVEVDQPQSYEALGIEQLLLGTQPPPADLGGVDERAVEDGGFASFGDSQGEWGVVVTVTGVLGLMRNGGR